MSAGALIFNRDGELLIVKPSYKDHWSIPGGAVEENESPLQACIRETDEEIGLKLLRPGFISVDYCNDIDKPEKGEALHFIFYGGEIDAREVALLKPALGEISEIKFVKLENASLFLSENLGQKIAKCVEALKNNTAVYLENGEIPHVLII